MIQEELNHLTVVLNILYENVCKQNFAMFVRLNISIRMVYNYIHFYSDFFEVAV